MTARRRLASTAAAVVVASLLACTGCGSTADERSTPLGEDYPGTCLPGTLSWPTDWLDALYGEDTDVIAGPIVGLRLEYLDSGWAWRVRSHAQKADWFGENIDDPSYGYEALVTVRELKLIRSRDVTLTEAEQQTGGSGAWSAAKASGETWPSPLVIDMTRVIDDGAAVWQVTTCDTATNQFHVQTMP